MRKIEAFPVLTLAVMAVLFLNSPYIYAQDTILGPAEQEAIRNCHEIYVKALMAYNGEESSKVAGLLEAAANAAKGADEDLAGLLEELKSTFDSTGIMSIAITRRLAIIFNTYNSQYNLGYPMLNPGNPRLAEPEPKNETRY